MKNKIKTKFMIETKVFYFLPCVKIGYHYSTANDRYSDFTLCFGFLFLGVGVSFKKVPKVNVFEYKIDDRVTYLGEKYRIVGIDIYNKEIALMGDYKKIYVPEYKLFANGDKL